MSRYYKIYVVRELIVTYKIMTTEYFKDKGLRVKFMKFRI